MRLDKLTTKFQQALADAQSMAVGNDNPYVEPLHVLSALLGQADGSGRALLERAGVNFNALRDSVQKAIGRLPTVQGHGGETPVSRELNNLLNLTDREAQKRGDQFIASELFLIVLADIAARPVGSSKRRVDRERRSSRPSKRCVAARASTMRRPKGSAKR